MLHDFAKIAPELRQAGRVDRGLQRVRQPLQRIASVGPGSGHVVRDRGSPGEVDVVGERQVRRDHGISAGHEASTDLGRAGHHESCRV